MPASEHGFVFGKAGSELALSEAPLTGGFHSAELCLLSIALAREIPRGMLMGLWTQASHSS